MAPGRKSPQVRASRPKTSEPKSVWITERLGLGPKRPSAQGLRTSRTQRTQTQSPTGAQEQMLPSPRPQEPMGLRPRTLQAITSPWVYLYTFNTRRYCWRHRRTRTSFRVPHHEEEQLLRRRPKPHPVPSGHHRMWPVCKCQVRGRLQDAHPFAHMPEQMFRAYN